MKIGNLKTGAILEVVDYLPKEGQVGKNQANALLRLNKNWHEVEEEKPKRKPRKKATPKKSN